MEEALDDAMVRLCTRQTQHRMQQTVHVGRTHSASSSITTTTSTLQPSHPSSRLQGRHHRGGSRARQHPTQPNPPYHTTAAAAQAT